MYTEADLNAKDIPEELRLLRKEVFDARKDTERADDPTWVFRDEKLEENIEAWNKLGLEIKIAEPIIEAWVGVMAITGGCLTAADPSYEYGHPHSCPQIAAMNGFYNVRVGICGIDFSKLRSKQLCFGRIGMLEIIKQDKSITKQSIINCKWNVVREGINVDSGRAGLFNTAECKDFLGNIRQEHGNWEELVFNDKYLFDNNLDICTAPKPAQCCDFGGALCQPA